MFVRKVAIVMLVAGAALGLAQQSTTPPTHQKDPAKVVKDPTQVPTVVGAPVDPDQTTEIDAVTFSDKSDDVYVPLVDFSDLIQWDLAYDDATKTTTIQGKVVPDTKMRQLWDGTTVVALSAFEDMGVTVQQLDDKSYGVKVENRSFEVDVPDKFVEVSISRQTLRAWQGQRLVMKTNISSGMPGHATPMGKYRSGPVKTEMHHSTLYENAPMPWAVEVYGDIFIHGSGSVPHHPASHGCIRMPLTGKNAAKYFYKWVDLGVKVNVLADWSDEARDLIALEDEGVDELAKDGPITPPTGIGHPPKRKPAVKKDVKKPVVIPKPDPTKFLGPAAPQKTPSSGG